MFSHNYSFTVSTDYVLCIDVFARCYVVPYMSAVQNWNLNAHIYINGTAHICNWYVCTENIVASIWGAKTADSSRYKRKKILAGGIQYGIHVWWCSYSWCFDTNMDIWCILTLRYWCQLVLWHDMEAWFIMTSAVWYRNLVYSNSMMSTSHAFWQCDMDIWWCSDSTLSMSIRVLVLWHKCLMPSTKSVCDGILTEQCGCLMTVWHLLTVWRGCVMHSGRMAVKSGIMVSTSHAL